jgi:uncharacterized membrane protein
MRRHQPWLVLVLVGAIVGVVFAAISTYDFVQHLDRQVHSLHCSFIPGVTHTGESGCQVAMLSPYSSVFRAQIWGGIPISLAATSVFAFLVFYTLDLMVTRRKDDPRATGFLALATALPAATSLVMLAISLSKLGTVCKLCVCIYVASAACLIGALVVWRTAARARRDSGPVEPRIDHRDRHRGEPAFVARAKAASSGHLIAVGVDTGPASGGFLAAMFVAGVAFVAVPVALYLAMAPDHARFIGTCEGLPRPDDTYGVMVRVERGAAHGAPTIEVLDPLCPACKAFEQRLDASGLADRLDRKAVLFPLDSTCNWMVTETTHPGACTVSEAVLCAGDKAPDVIAWAFEEQERVRAAAKTDPAAAARIVKQRFPELAACVGSPDARSRLNKSLRWIVANNIRVLTPQVFIDRVKLCDEDVDLGLEYTLSNMLERHAQGKLAPVPLEKGPGARQPGDKSTAGDGPGGPASSDKAAPDKTAPDKAGSDKAASDKAASDKAASGEAAPDRAAGKSALDTAAPEGKAASGEAASDKAAPDKAGSDKAATDSAPSDKAAPDKAASDKPDTGNTAGGKPASDSAASDKAAADKAPSGKAAAGKATSSESPDKADAAGSDKASSDKPPPRRVPPRRVPPRKPPPEKTPSDNGPADQPVTRPGDVP